MKLEKPLLCIDLETTGIDPVTYDAIQIGAVLTDRELNITKEFVNYIRPMSVARTSKAMEINQISESVLAVSESFKTNMEKFYDHMVSGNPWDLMLAAWPLSFDIPFLHTQFDKANMKWPFHHVGFDVKCVCKWELTKRGVPFEKQINLKACVESMGLTWEGTAHDALADVKNSIRLLKRLADG